MDLLPGKRLDSKMGALGAVFEASWAVLEASWALLGRSWRRLGALEASWALLGVSWALLGRSWRRLGRILGALGSILRANWEAKRVQNRAQEMIRAENDETLIFDNGSMNFNDF